MGKAGAAILGDGGRGFSWRTEPAARESWPSEGFTLLACPQEGRPGYPTLAGGLWRGNGAMAFLPGFLEMT